MVHSPLTTRFEVTSDYSSRGGATIDSIGHHHAAGTSLEVALALFQPGGRTVSPNYCIRGRDIVLVVPEEYRAWTSASGQDDARSITYEIINSTGSPSWAFDPATLDSVMRLNADIMRRYPAVKANHGMPGFWEHRNLNEWFGRSYATACAGPSFDIKRIVYGSAAVAAIDVTPIENLIAKGHNMFLAYDADAGRKPEERQLILVTVDAGQIRGKYLEDPIERAVFTAITPALPVAACDAPTFAAFLDKIGYAYGAPIPLINVKTTVVNA